jgi:hypothetical protein
MTTELYSPTDKTPWNGRSYCWYLFVSTELPAFDTDVILLVLSRLPVVHCFQVCRMILLNRNQDFSPLTSLTADPTSHRPEVDLIHAHTNNQHDRWQTTSCWLRYRTWGGGCRVDGWGLWVWDTGSRIGTDSFWQETTLRYEEWLYLIRTLVHWPV